ncbi:BQ2448_6542 [Microbotryum intermedium]|uniref:BQ2448_6542 protein n=1 Tax=Microbotryum intermedium TaxID=269621 RepID=A0A238FJZ2_9BASI|nr:BQ2448_6542 [Microbotryum intermedium]
MNINSTDDPGGTPPPNVLVPSSPPGRRMLHVHYHHSSYPPNSALAMKDASRKMKRSATDYRDQVQGGFSGYRRLWLKGR